MIQRSITNWVRAIVTLIALVFLMFIHSHPLQSQEPTPPPLPDAISIEEATPPSAETPATALTFTVTNNAFIPVVRTGIDPFTLQFIQAINNERAAVGCAPLTAETRLMQAAQDHTRDMLVLDFFSHTSPNGDTPADRVAATGYRYRTMGENIAAGYGSIASVMDGWMDSEGHRDNILNCRFTEVGVGYVSSDEDRGDVRFGTYWTQVFATPLN